MKISYDKFRRMMADPDVPERELRAYLRADEPRSGPFSPSVLPDPEKVAITEDELAFEGALDFGNSFCRFRRRRAFEARERRGDTAPVLVSEGDSWFQFPFLIEDVVDHLGRDHMIWSVGAAGDTVHNMVFAQPEYMAALERNAARVQAFLFSAAGNDVIGEDRDGRPMLARLIRQNTGFNKPSALVDQAALMGQLAEIRRAYETVIATVRADARFATLPIIVHGYDYCFPGSPTDHRKPVYASPDQWLGRAFAERGVDDPSVRRGIVKILIDSLYETLAEVAAADPAGKVFVVDARGSMPVVEDWADEIHGTDAGFAKVADRFRATLDTALSRPARHVARPLGFETERAAPTGATIVLDAGHGGTEKVGGSSPNNATGPGGTLEKTLVLEIARLAQTELTQRGHRVLMTRASDRNLGLAERAAVARDKHAAVFVSLHFNGWHLPSVQGTETLHHPQAGPASIALARAVQAAVLAVTGLRDRGVKPLNLGVLRPSRHDPATACCLAEISFLTDPAEEARLADPRYLTRLAVALADGIEAYLRDAPAVTGPGFESAMIAAAGDTADEIEDAAVLGLAARPAVSGTAPRVRPIRRADPDAIARGPAALHIAGLTDAGQFLNAWRERQFKSNGFDVGGKFERKVGTDDTLPAAFLEAGAAVARAVCKIEASGVAFDGQPGAWNGTGFLVAPNLLLTNNHVLNDIAVARSAMVQFGYEVGRHGRFSPVRSYTLDPDRLFITSPAVGGLDYTFVHLDGDAHTEFGMIPLDRGAFVIAPGERANIVHHPSGQPKRVSLRANQSIDFDQLLLHYVSDTEHGSSGAPVFDDTWRLIALHHAWETLPPNVSLPGGHDVTFANEGIKIAAIVADLESRLTRPAEGVQARRVLDVVRGSDSITGYFGVTARRVESAPVDAIDRVKAVYGGGAQDIDIGHWTVDWFMARPHERAADTATVLVDLNLDIWTLPGCDAKGAEILRRQLANEFGQDFASRVHEGPEGCVATLWNPLTLAASPVQWPDAAGLPPLYRFRTLERSAKGMTEFDFLLAPLPGALASGVEARAAVGGLAAATVATVQRDGAADWVFTGTRTPDALTRGLGALSPSGYVALAAEDDAEGAIAALKRPGSLIDRVVFAPAMRRRHGAEDCILTAQDDDSPESVRRLSGRRPLLVRLNMLDTAPAVVPPVAPKPEASPVAPTPAISDAREQLVREILDILASRGL
jgi:N-acetylmuramoyl-L-alanine amidase